MADEKRAYTRLKKVFPGAHWQRIESWTGAGIFDVNGCMNGVECWVECKEARAPKTKRGLIRCEVKRGQAPWEFLRRQAGGRTFIALMVNDVMFLLPGAAIRFLKDGVTQTWVQKNEVPISHLFKP